MAVAKHHFMMLHFFLRMVDVGNTNLVKVAIPNRYRS